MPAIQDSEQCCLRRRGGKLRPVAYASRGLRESELNMDNYSTMKLEFLALKWVVTEKL